MPMSFVPIGAKSLWQRIPKSCCHLLALLSVTQTGWLKSPNVRRLDSSGLVWSIRGWKVIAAAEGRIVIKADWVKEHCL
jgi:hypothetical protein